MLQPTQKANVRLYLGYPDQFRDIDTRLESILTTISPEAEVQIISILGTLATIENLIITTGLVGAGIKRLDEIWFENGSKQLSEQRKAGRSYVARLSIILGVPVNSDVFGTTGYLGDTAGSGLGEPNGSAKFYGLG